MLKEIAYLKSNFQNQVLTVSLYGEVDHHSAHRLREEIDRLLYTYRPRQLTLSLAHVGFMDSSGLGLILGRLDRVCALGAKMVLCDVDPRIRAILSLAGVERLPGIRIEEEANA